MRILNVARVLVINAQNQALVLVRHHDDDYRPGEPDLPGGEIHADESPAKAAVRELEEEAGIALKSELTLVYVGAGLTGGMSVNGHLFVAHVDMPDIIISNEHQAYVWQTVDQIVADYGDRLYSQGIRYAQENGLLGL